MAITIIVYGKPHSVEAAGDTPLLYVLLNCPDEKPLGVGEGAQGPTVAAIANAIANATGKRLRDLPFTRERVKAALA